MKLRFDANQDFQLDAINAIADLFEGQRRHEMSFAFNLGVIPAVPNRLDISEYDILQNLQAVQKRNFDPRHEDGDYHGDEALEYLAGEAVTATGKREIRFPNFSVEMETGTGKTYVYLRTALELYRRYGFRKFIIVVPSVAIREGVLKTLQVTREHFRQIFDNTPYRYYSYDSSNLTHVRQFALSDSVEFMVMTLAAFNKADINVIHQSSDRLMGEIPIQLIQSTRPILILDEPQNMESELSITSLSSLNPLFALRYSATHRVPYNVVYRLSPAAAYRRGLVKRIEVASTLEEGHVNHPYIRLLSIKASKRTITAKLAIHRITRSGEIREVQITAGPGASLLILSEGHTVYEGYEIDEIHAGNGYVRFANSHEVRLNEAKGDNKEAIFEAQIRYTLIEHIRKQERLRPLGIKVLSLFFIDRVDNYAPEDSIIRTLFAQVFSEYKSQVPEWRELDANQVSAAYFAQRRTRGGDIFLEDSKTGASAKDREAYELIMKEKERLLSLNEPVAFIFSHSALREGWDNPNVFQICTLNQSVSDMRKRQEIGRGVRLVVDQSGQRITDERINVLTVVANESYEDYVKQLQAEINEEYMAEIEARFGKPFKELSAAEQRKVMREYGDVLPPMPTDARRRVTLHLKKQFELRPEFKGIWERISQKTRYQVSVDTEKLVTDVTEALRNVHIEPPRISVTKAAVDVNFVNVFEAWQMSAAKTLVNLVGRYPLPNLVDLMLQLLEHSSPPVRLTKKTLLRILENAPYPQEFVDNPVDFATKAVAIIRQKLIEQLPERVTYHKIGEWFAMSEWTHEIETWEEHVVRVNNSAYDGIVVDSDVERRFVEELERHEQVLFYLKLPRWFKVSTPIGNYNPDWAIVLKDSEHEMSEPATRIVYVIAETKGTLNPYQLRFDSEVAKITFGRVHFENGLAIPYQVVTCVADVFQEKERWPLFPEGVFENHSVSALATQSA